MELVAGILVIVKAHRPAAGPGLLVLCIDEGCLPFHDRPFHLAPIAAPAEGLILPPLARRLPEHPAAAHCVPAQGQRREASRRRQQRKSHGYG